MKSFFVDLCVAVVWRFVYVMYIFSAMRRWKKSGIWSKIVMFSKSKEWFSVTACIVSPVVSFVFFRCTSLRCFAIRSFRSYLLSIFFSRSDRPGMYALSGWISFGWFLFVIIRCRICPPFSLLCLRRIRPDNHYLSSYLWLSLGLLVGLSGWWIG